MNTYKKIDRKLAVRLFKYYNGSLFWKEKISQRTVIGKRAGSSHTKGYREVSYLGFRHLEHRMIYTILVGDIPDGYEIDHRDENKSNNYIDNLRLATPKQNKWNRKKYKRNTSGYKGVVRNGRYWVAQISVENKIRYIGSFKSPKLAFEAYKKEEIKRRGEFYNACLP